jgi:uncharacterized membrane protein YtjA (UPF0391 family)
MNPHISGGGGIVGAAAVDPQIFFIVNFFAIRLISLFNWEHKLM